MKSIIKSLLIVSMLPFTVVAESSVDVKSQFKAVYGQYKESLRTRNIGAQTKFALQSYELGKKLYGENDINTINLGFNLARHYYQNRNSMRANELLPDIFEKLEEHYGEYSVELMNFYITIANTISWNDLNKTFKYYDKALDIADEIEDEEPLLTAEIRRLVGADFLEYGTTKSKVLLDARKYFVENLLATDQRVIEANFWAGKYYMSLRKYDDAIDLFNSNINIFEKNDIINNPLELNTRAFLIFALENEGRSDEATQHCINIGKSQKWDDTRKPKPLFRVQPRYPTLMAKQDIDGSVKMEFMIDESGITTDIKVLSFTNVSFKNAAVKALKKWRYAPKFENGKPIKAKSWVVLDFKVS